MLEDSNYAVRSATSDDIDRLVAFHARVFRPSVGTWAKQLLSGTHPTVSVSDFSIIEDPNSGEIISSLCFIRQRWLFDGVPLEVGQMELVGTDERYRRRGFIHAQLEWFAEKLKHHNCLLSSVRGLPALYQRLGYQFAIPLKGGAYLRLDQIPTFSEREWMIVRHCTQFDLPHISVFYDKVAQSLDIHLPRNLALWNYQENQLPESEHAYETYVVERAEQVVGYARWPQHTKLDAIVIKELMVNGYEELLALLSFAREWAINQKLSTIILQLPQIHPVMSVIEHWGAQLILPFAWQVRVVDWLDLFTAIQQVLEARLSRSLLAFYSEELRISLTETSRVICFIFEQGKIIKIMEEFNSTCWHLILTAPILTMLVMGYHSRKELEQWHLEMQTQVEAKYLIDVLFPKLDTFIYEPY